MSDTIKFPSGAIITAHATEDDWLAYRRARIGGSDMAALFGVSPWASPYSVWAEKAGVLADADHEASERMRWGNWLERGLAQGYASMYGVRIHDLGRWTTVQHPKIPWLYATLDFVADEDGMKVLVECKNSDISKAGEWCEGVIGEDADSGPKIFERAIDGVSLGSAPIQYQIQGQAQLAATGLEICDLFALIGGNRSVRVRMYRDEVFIGQMIETGNDMARRIAEMDAPEPDGHEATRKAQKLRWPEHVEGSTAILEPSHAELLIERLEVAEKIKSLGKRQTAIETKLLDGLADHEFALVPGFGRISSTMVAGVEVKYTRKPYRKVNWPRKCDPAKAEKMIREFRAAQAVANETKESTDD